MRFAISVRGGETWFDVGGVDSSLEVCREDGLVDESSLGPATGLSCIVLDDLLMFLERLCSASDEQASNFVRRSPFSISARPGVDAYPLAAGIARSNSLTRFPCAEAAVLCEIDPTFDLIVSFFISSCDWICSRNSRRLSSALRCELQH